MAFSNCGEKLERWQRTTVIIEINIRGVKENHLVVSWLEARFDCCDLRPGDICSENPRFGDVLRLFSTFVRDFQNNHAIKPFIRKILY